MTIDYFYFWIELFKQNTCFVSILHKCKFSSKVRALEIPCPMELAADLLRLPHNPPGQLLVNFNLGRIISLLHSRGLFPWRQLVKNLKENLGTEAILVMTHEQRGERPWTISLVKCTAKKERKALLRRDYRFSYECPVLQWVSVSVTKS